MDETPAQLESIRDEAAAIDVHQYRKRFRAMKAIGLGAAGAGLVWLVLIMFDSRRNPCQRVRDYFCRQPSSERGDLPGLPVVRRHPERVGRGFQPPDAPDHPSAMPNQD